MGRGLLQRSCCSSEKMGKGEQERPELLLLAAGAVVWLGKEISRRCSGYRIVRL